MEKDRRAAAFRQAAGALPPRLRALALALPEGAQSRAAALRLRAGRPSEEEVCSGGCAVCGGCGE